MSLVYRLFRLSVPSVLLVVASCVPALATQGHGGIEGVYVHQLAHFFFAVSMGLLTFWLRRRGLTREPGWRFIQYAAWCFVAWNLDAMLVHALEEQWGVFSTTTEGLWQVRVRCVPHAAWMRYLYCTAKMDHLLCVPAMWFLYAGLKRLAGKPHQDALEPGH